MTARTSTPLRVACTTAVGALAALLLVGTGCRQLGTSEPRAPSPDSVTVLWSGAVTDSSARVVVRLPGSPSDEPSVRLAVTASPGTPDWTTGVSLVDGTRVPSNDRVHHFRLTGLSPQTTYHYAVQTGGTVDTTRTGRFETFGEGAFSFRVAIGACAETGSQHPVFHAIRSARPDLILHVGDMHYEDIAAAQKEPFRRAYRQVHASRTQSALYRSAPIAYVWDDHDYGPNNSSRAAPGQDAAQEVYREYVPHYDLPAGEGSRPIYQAFTVGRVRFLVTDLRSARTRNDAPDSVQTMMGEEQKAWFKDQLRAARDRYPVVAWVSSVPWIGDEPGDDRWAGFARERRELATFIDSIGVADRLVILSGDAHMVAVDDGTNNHFGERGEDGGGFPVVHAAALDRRGSVKGGPYTHGPYPNRTALFGENDGQYVLMDVDDAGAGEEVCVTWTGKRYRFDDGRLDTLLQWKRCFPGLSDEGSP